MTETPNNLGSADGQSGGGVLPLWLLITSILSLASRVGVRWVGASRLLPIILVVVTVAQGHGCEDPLDEILLVL